MHRWIGSLCLVLLLAGSAYAAKTHGRPDMIGEMRAWMGELLPSTLVAGCMPTVPGSSLTFGAFSCGGYVPTGTGELAYVSQPASALTLANTNGTHWLGVCHDTSSTVAGWTRQSATHYVHQQSATQPANVAGCTTFAKVTVAASVISAVELWGTRWITQGVGFAAAATFGTGSHVVVHATGLIDHGANAMTFNGTFTAMPEHRQVFQGAGTVTFGPRSVEQVSTAWFGAVGDGSANCTSYGTGTNNTAAFQRAVNSIPSYAGIAIYVPGGCYDFATAPTLKAGLTITGPSSPAPSLGAGFEKPAFVYGGTGTFLLFNADYISLSNVRLLGNNVAGTTGIEITAANARLSSVTVEGFTGAGSFGIHIHGTAVVTNEADWFNGDYLFVRSNQTGWLFDGAPTNNNFCWRCLVTGNVNDGVRIGATTQVLTFFGDIEGNCTSGGSCFDLNIQAGRWLRFTGWTENATTTKTINLPTCDPLVANYIYIMGYHSTDSSTIRAKLNTASASGCTFYMDFPFGYNQTDPSFYSQLSIGEIKTHDTIGNVLASLIGWISTRGNITMGLRNVRSTRISLRGDASVVNTPGSNAINLSTGLSDAAPLNGILWVWISADNEFCEFKVVADVATELRDTGTMCSHTLGTASSVNVGNTAGALFIENLRSGTRTFGYHFFGAN